MNQLEYTLNKLVVNATDRNPKIIARKFQCLGCEIGQQGLHMSEAHLTRHILARYATLLIIFPQINVEVDSRRFLTKGDQGSVETRPCPAGSAIGLAVYAEMANDIQWEVRLLMKGGCSHNHDQIAILNIIVCFGNTPGYGTDEMC